MMQQNPQDIKNAIAQELARCKQDAVYFITKYCYIQHPMKGRIKFNLYPFQEDCLKQFMIYDKNIILKSRQLGLSTLTAAYSLWMCLFFVDKNILVVATKQEVAKNLITKVRVMYSYLPSWMTKGQRECEENNILSMKLRTGSGIKAVSSAGDAGRSEAISLLVVDEMAFIQRIEELWASIQPTLSTGGKAILLSTPNGVGNLFHKIWVKGEQKSNGFNTIRLPWTVHPERDQTWRDQQTAELGEEMANQECECSFLQSGRSVISPAILQEYSAQTCDPTERRGIGGDYWIWDYPDYSRDYVVVADVARGDGQDYSAFHVIDVENVEQVAEFRGKVDTKEYGNMLVSVATDYNNALLVIENANIGWAVIQQVIDRDYKNLYYSYKDTQVIDSTVHLAKGYDLKDKSQMTPGFTTSGKTRPLIISKMELYFRERLCIVKSKRLIDELYVFVWNGSKAEAQHGYNDDLVMSFAISMWVRDTALKLRTEGLNLTKQTLSGIRKTGNESYPGLYIPRNHNSQWNMNHSRGNEDLTWLI